MADGALYIRGAIKNLWSQITPTLCLFHFIKAYRTKLYNKEFVPAVQIKNGKLDNKTIPSNILECFNTQLNLPEKEKYNPTRVISNDIKILQALPTEAFFSNYLSLIKSFWIFFGKKFLDILFNKLC